RSGDGSTEGEEAARGGQLPENERSRGAVGYNWNIRGHPPANRVGREVGLAQVGRMMVAWPNFRRVGLALPIRPIDVDVSETQGKTDREGKPYPTFLLATFRDGRAGQPMIRSPLGLRLDASRPIKDQIRGAASAGARGVVVDASG